MKHAYLLIGGNMGDRMALLLSAAEKIQRECGTVLKKSSVYRTAAWGLTEQPDFYNQCLELKSKFDPKELMQHLLAIETQMGRVREEKMGPRLIDIDILLFENEIIDTPLLQIPHPRLHLRKFALIPLAEIAPEIVHPVLNKSIALLSAECTDELDVHKI